MALARCSRPVIDDERRDRDELDLRWLSRWGRGGAENRRMHSPVMWLVGADERECEEGTERRREEHEQHRPPDARFKSGIRQHAAWPR
jgi:hypothetical protein